MLAWLRGMPSGRQELAALVLPLSLPLILMAKYFYWGVGLSFGFDFSFGLSPTMGNLLIMVLLTIGLASILFVFFNRRTLTGICFANAVAGCLPMLTLGVFVLQIAAYELAQSMAGKPTGDESERVLFYRSIELNVSLFVLIPGLLALIILPVALTILRRKQIRWGEFFVYATSCAVMAATSYVLVTDFSDNTNYP